jgi:hypothetical protein
LGRAGAALRAWLDDRRPPCQRRHGGGVRPADDGGAQLAADQYGAPWTLEFAEETGASLELEDPPGDLHPPDPVLAAVWAGALGPLGDLRDSLGWATANAIEYPMTYQPVPPVTYMHGPEGSILVITPQESGTTWQEYE